MTNATNATNAARTLPPCRDCGGERDALILALCAACRDAGGRRQASALAGQTDALAEAVRVREGQAMQDRLLATHARLREARALRDEVAALPTPVRLAAEEYVRALDCLASARHLDDRDASLYWGPAMVNACFLLRDLALEVGLPRWDAEDLSRRLRAHHLMEPAA
jgi:hypothetical protein